MVDFVDPDRDLAKAERLSREYDVSTPDTVVFEIEGRTKYVGTEDIVDYERSVDVEKLLAGQPSVTRRRSGFKAEQAFSSAIQSITQPAMPVVYFLKGHGERDIDDYGKHSGYSRLALVMRRDNMDVKSLLLVEEGAVPADCSALVLAGPDKRLSVDEIDIISDYLSAGGRAAVLIDPATTSGMETFLENWGVQLARDVVVGLTLSGRDLFVKDYADHAITRGLKDVVTVFYMPRSVEPIGGASPSDDQLADKPRVSALATSEGWAETDMGSDTPRFDDGVDRPGPISIAVAVEKGAVSGIEVEVKPTRMVVIGDSDFVSNGALISGVGGNIDFFMSAVNWLLEREELMAIAPKVPGELRLDMNREEIRLALLLMGVAAPAVVAFAGLLVWLRRRR